MLAIEKNDDINSVVEKYTDYICSETLATIDMVENIGDVEAIELIDGVSVKLKISKK